MSRSTASPCRTATREDKDCADLLVILMKVAKSLEQVRKLPHLSADDAYVLVLQTQGDLFGTIEWLYPGPGEMQRRVIAFADRLGFDMRERNFVVQSNAIH